MRWLCLSALVILAACRASSVTITPEPSGADGVIGVLDTPIEFEGSRSTTIDPELLSEIRIGFFGPSDGSDPVGEMMYRAATLAINEANDSGGYQGKTIRLFTRWNADPWRGGSRELARLVYPDSVCAVIGSIDGDATHLAEQITHKMWVPLISPVSADPTLTYVNVPWIFRIPPDEETQAQLLIREVIQPKAFSRVGLITATSHDGRVFAGEVKELLNEANLAPIFHLQVSAADFLPDQVAARAISFTPDVLVLRLPSQHVVSLVNALRERDNHVPVLLPWIPGLEGADLDGWPAFSVQPFVQQISERYRTFEEHFRSHFGNEPTAAAAFTYDATKLLIEALSISGPDRIALRQAIWEQSGYQGVTGTIRWDNGGGNIGNPVVRNSDPYKD